MPKTQRCEAEDKECRCGTGDTGCIEPPMNHMSSSMCNGVFAPVCAPEVCNVPRIPHHEILVEGQGVLLDTHCQQRICFNIFVEREMQVYRGGLELKDLRCGGISVKAYRLKFFESNGTTQMQAIFYEESTGRNIMVTVYKEEKGEEREKKKKEPTRIFIYSASIEAESINLCGKVVAGEIKLYADHNVHGH